MKIGKVELKYGVLMGPMAGVTDMPFRLLAKEQGCELAYTEMVSAKAIYYNNKKTDQLLEVAPQEGLVGVQLFGSEPQLMAEMADRVDHDQVGLFDVNMGCPVPKIVNNGEGSALMKKPHLVYDIVKAMADYLDKPVTVKIRKGFDENHANAVEVALAAEEAGAQAVAVHGRTRDQYYSGQADWSIIAKVKEALSIPVIGNGDVFSGQDALDLKKETGCDGVMIARGAKGNPWIFADVIAAFKGNQGLDRPSDDQVKTMILRHAKSLIAHKGEYIAMREMRKHVAWYVKGRRGAAGLRGKINQAQSLQDLVDLLN